MSIWSTTRKTRSAACWNIAACHSKKAACAFGKPIAPSRQQAPSRCAFPFIAMPWISGATSNDGSVRSGKRCPNQPAHSGAWLDVLSHQHFLCHGASQTTGLESMRCTTRMLLMGVAFATASIPAASNASPPTFILDGYKFSQPIPGVNTADLESKLKHKPGTHVTEADIDVDT